MNGRMTPVYIYVYMCVWDHARLCLTVMEGERLKAVESSRGKLGHTMVFFLEGGGGVY